MPWCIRTTITIDDDVAALLEQERRTRGVSLKEAVNEALRERYRTSAQRPAPRRFQTRSVSVGELHLANLDDVAEVLDHIEGEDPR